MKEIHIVWNEVTAHSRFWAIVLFVGVLPGSAFYAGVRVERLRNEQNRLTQFSQQTLFQSEHGMCRISDCTLQALTGEVAGNTIATSTSATSTTPAARKASSKSSK